KQLKNILAFETTSIMIFSGEKNIIAATLGYKDEALVCREMPVCLQKSPLIKRIIRTLQPIIIQDVREEKDWIWVPGAEHVRSWIGVPLIAGNKVTGVLSIDKNQVGFYTGKDVEAVQALTEQTAMAIENARLFKDLDEEKGRLELLYDLSSRFTSDLGIEKVLPWIIDRITAELGGHIGYIFSFEPDEKMLRMQAVSGIKVSASTLDNEARLSLGQGLNGWVMLNKKPAVVPDVTKDKRWYYVDEIDHDVHAAISVPLFLGEKVVGVISVIHPDVGYFNSSEHLHLLTAVSNQVAVIMEKALLYKKLKDSEERFRHVTANTGDWVWEVDVQGRITYSSPVITQILGYSYQEVLGKYARDLSLPEKREKLKTDFNKMVKTKKPYTAFVNCILHKDGHKVMLESSGTPIIDRNGKVTGYRGADHDITARLQAETALAASELKYRILVENANNWIWTLDLEGHLTFFNQAAEEASGYKSAEWIGQNFIPLILPEELPAVQQIYSEILKGKSKSYETRIYNKDGKVIALAVNTAPLYKDGVITGTVSMGQDITKQKQLETQLRQAQKMEAIGTLAGGIAHDFNNILSGILGYVSLMKLDLTSDKPLCTELDAVVSLVNRASDLTRQLLGFARGGRYQVQPVNLNDIINEVINLLSRTVDKSILIKPVLDPNLSAVEADAGQIQQM
ncbi:MAG: PAS domain S-box protein, partial [Spirochaetales bacterium]|nr:PAS domain S-box protein [Spirochaetales bacterium]